MVLIEAYLVSRLAKKRQGTKKLAKRRPLIKTTNRMTGRGPPGWRW